MEQISQKSSSTSSEEGPTSSESKARSSSDSKVEVSEPRRSRSSRSRSNSLEIDENVHRDLEQQKEQPLSNGQGTIHCVLVDQKILTSAIIIWTCMSKPAPHMVHIMAWSACNFMYVE